MEAGAPLFQNLPADIPDAGFGRCRPTISRFDRLLEASQESHRWGDSFQPARRERRLSLFRTDPYSQSATRTATSAQAHESPKSNGVVSRTFEAAKSALSNVYIFKSFFANGETGRDRDSASNLPFSDELRRRTPAIYPLREQHPLESPPRDTYESPETSPRLFTSLGAAVQADSPLAYRVSDRGDNPAFYKNKLFSAHPSPVLRPPSAIKSEIRSQNSALEFPTSLLEQVEEKSINEEEKRRPEPSAAWSFRPGDEGALKASRRRLSNVGFDSSTILASRVSPRNAPQPHRHITSVIKSIEKEYKDRLNLSDFKSSQLKRKGILGDYEQTERANQEDGADREAFDLTKPVEKNQPGKQQSLDVSSSDDEGSQTTAPVPSKPPPPASVSRPSPVVEFSVPDLTKEKDSSLPTPVEVKTPSEMPPAPIAQPPAPAEEALPWWKRNLGKPCVVEVEDEGSFAENAHDLQPETSSPAAAGTSISQKQATPSFGASAAPSLFGNALVTPRPAAQPTGSGSLFGGMGLFGTQPPATVQPPSQPPVLTQASETDKTPVGVAAPSPPQGIIKTDTPLFGPTGNQKPSDSNAATSWLPSAGPSIFSKPQSSASLFGTDASTIAEPSTAAAPFGSMAAKPATSIFGTPPQASATTLFGEPSKTATPSLFGIPPPTSKEDLTMDGNGSSSSFLGGAMDGNRAQSQPVATSLFGGIEQPKPAASLFGSQGNAASFFGAEQSKSGSAVATSPVFGTESKLNGGNSLFSAQTPSQSIFGTAVSPSGPFYSTPMGQEKSASFGSSLFGPQGTAFGPNSITGGPSSLFGGASSAPQNEGSTTGLFGATFSGQPSPTSFPTSPGTFSTPMQQSSSLFGQPSIPGAVPASTSLFGATPTSQGDLAENMFTSGASTRQPKYRIKRRNPS